MVAKKAASKPAPGRAMSATKTTAVAKRPPTPLAVAKAPGRGFEEADKDAFAIPFLIIVQDKAKIMDTVDCEVGDIVNTATGAVYSEVDVIPVLYRRRFVRWGPRAQGGGFKGELPPSTVDDMITEGTVVQGDEDQNLYYPQPDGSVSEKKCDYLKDTRSHFVLVDGQPAMIAMASSQIKKSRNWMSAMQHAGGDMWDHKWTLTSVQQQNDQGDWYGWNITISDEKVTDEERQRAENFYQSIAEGKVKVDHGAADNAGEESERF